MNSWTVRARSGRWVVSEPINFLPIYFLLPNCIPFRPTTYGPRELTGQWVHKNLQNKSI